MISQHTQKFLKEFVWDFSLLKEFTAPRMGVDVGGVGGGGDGSREKGVRHLARVFKSPISLHKDQLSTLRDEAERWGKKGCRPSFVLISFLRLGEGGKCQGIHQE